MYRVMLHLIYNTEHREAVHEQNVHAKVTINLYYNTELCSVDSLQQTPKIDAIFVKYSIQTLLQHV